MAQIVMEGTSAWVTVRFYDKAGNLAAPASATWQAHDLASGTELKAETALTPASTIEIAVPASVNEIVNERLAKETRRITIKASYGVDDKANAQFDYEVRNLGKVS